MVGCLSNVYFTSSILLTWELVSVQMISTIYEPFCCCVIVFLWPIGYSELDIARQQQQPLYFGARLGC